jgi:NAD(P)H-flavin reductase
MRQDSGTVKKAKQCELLSNTRINSENFTLRFNWDGTSPKAGQFFMIRPEQSGVFLPRAISVNEYSNSTLKFLITKAGKGTIELSKMREGSRAELTGPLGNIWRDFIDSNSLKKIALISGGAGISPLSAYANETSEINCHFYSGFKNTFENENEAKEILGPALKSTKLILAFENYNKDAVQNLNFENTSVSTGAGLITGFFNAGENYGAVLSCGPVAMLKTVKELCGKASLPCYISMDKKMACGVGACLGCTVKTINGNRRCCADGPIFNAREVVFD